MIKLLGQCGPMIPANQNNFKSAATHQWCDVEHLQRSGASQSLKLVSYPALHLLHTLTSFKNFGASVRVQKKKKKKKVRLTFLRCSPHLLRNTSQTKCRWWGRKRKVTRHNRCRRLKCHRLIEALSSFHYESASVPSSGADNVPALCSLYVTAKGLIVVFTPLKLHRRDTPGTFTDLL